MIFWLSGGERTLMPHVEKTRPVSPSLAYHRPINSPTVVKCLYPPKGVSPPHLANNPLPTHPGIALNRQITAIFSPPSLTTCANNA